MIIRHLDPWGGFAPLPVSSGHAKKRGAQSTVPLRANPFGVEGLRIRV